MTVTFCSRSFLTMVKSRAISPSEMAAVGSSMIRTSASDATALAISTICFWATLRVETRWRGEIERLFSIIRALREKNVTVIYISHRLDEIFELGDTVTVMRDGRHVGTRPVSEVKDRSELIRMMIGKTVFEGYEPRPNVRKDVVLRVQGLSNHKLSDVSFDVHRGEIVGFYGLVGAGKTELARAIYGADPYRGQVLFHGAPLPRRPDQVIEAGIALVPEERRSSGTSAIPASMTWSGRVGSFFPWKSTSPR